MVEKRELGIDKAEDMRDRLSARDQQMIAR